MKAFTPFIIIGICIGMYFVYISPTLNDVRDLSLKKSNYDAVLLQAGEVTKQRDNVLIEKNNISDADINKLNKIVPETFNSVLFANDMNAIAARNGMVIKDFTVNPQRTEDRESVLTQSQAGPYKTTVSTFRLMGQYGQFIQFLRELESSLRLVDVVRLSIKTVGGTRTADNSLEYLLEINTYSLR